MKWLDDKLCQHQHVPLYAMLCDADGDSASKVRGAAGGKDCRGGGIQDAGGGGGWGAAHVRARSRLCLGTVIQHRMQEGLLKVVHLGHVISHLYLWGLHGPVVRCMCWHQNIVIEHAKACGAAGQWIEGCMLNGLMATLNAGVFQKSPAQDQDQPVAGCCGPCAGGQSAGGGQALHGQLSGAEGVSVMCSVSGELKGSDVTGDPRA